MEEPHTKKHGLYRILGLETNASEADIRKQYFKLSRIYHPDRHSNAKELQQIAIQHFRAIEYAKTILLEPEKRLIYDILGYKGLQLFTQEQQENKDSRNILQMWKNRKLKFWNLQIFHAKYKINLSNIFVGARKIKEIALELPVAAAEWTVGFSNRKTVSAGIALQKNKTGLLPILFLAHSFYWLNGIQFIIRGYFVGNWLVELYAIKQFSKHDIKLTGKCAYLFLQSKFIQYITVSKSFLDEKISVNLTNRDFENFQPSASYQTDNYKVELGFNEVSLNYLIGGLYLPQHFIPTLSVEFDLSHYFTNSFLKNLTFSTKFSYEQGITFKLNREQPSYEYGFSSSVDLFQPIINYKFSFMVEKHHIQFPIAIGMVPLQWMLFFLTSPLAGFVLVNRVDFSAIKRWNVFKSFKRDEKELLQKKQAKQKIQIEKMMSVVESSRVTEEARMGLIILEALYGNFGANNSEILPYIDVTIPLQYLVSDSKLILSSREPKHVLEGFYDPCPGENKTLWIKYKFQGREHSASFADSAPIGIPKEKHRSGPRRPI